MFPLRGEFHSQPVVLLFCSRLSGHLLLGRGFHHLDLVFLYKIQDGLFVHSFMFSLINGYFVHAEGERIRSGLQASTTEGERTDGAPMICLAHVHHTIEHLMKPAQRLLVMHLLLHEHHGHHVLLGHLLSERLEEGIGAL